MYVQYPSHKKGALQLQKVCGFLSINLVGPLFLKLHFVLILDLAGMVATWSILLI